MKKHTLSVLLLFVAVLAIHAQNTTWRSKVAPEILAAFDQGQHADCLIAFREKADLSGAAVLNSKSEKAHFVYNRLVETATHAQVNAIRLLREKQANVNSFYVVNAISVTHASLEMIRQIAELPEVQAIAADPDIHFNAPLETPDTEIGARTTEWGIEKINAPAVWAMGFTGQGITVGGADTGYEWYHPAIEPHYRGFNAADSTANHNYNWHDAIHQISPLSGDSLPLPSNNPCGVNSLVPCDDYSHGTHTMGTMTGDDGMGNQIGVAPGAKWIGCRNMERGNGQTSTYIECFQWFLAPTDLNNANPNPDKAPHVINNSWYCSGAEGCTDVTINELMRQAVINLKASGVVVVVSNGNFGNAGCSTTNIPPAYFQESFSIGATRDNDGIALFSSRGPITIDGSNRIKPNVSAPGQNVRSSVRGGGYANYSGTSMAGPHVVGLVALVLSARPDLAGQVSTIENIIEQTAIPFSDTFNCTIPGDSRPNNIFGWGRVDALAAVNAALAVPTNTPLSTPLSANVFPNPVQDEAIFDIQNMSGNIMLDVFSANGQRVAGKTWTSTQTRELVPVSLKSLPSGVYFWQIRTESGVLKGDLVKN